MSSRGGGVVGTGELLRVEEAQALLGIGRWIDDLAGDEEVA
jgi:hypothetical protein